MLNIANDWGNANQIYTGISALSMAFITMSANSKGWKGWQEKGILYTIGRNVNWYRYYGEHYGGSLKKTNTEAPYNPAIPLLGISRENHDLKGYMYPNVNCSMVYGNLLQYSCLENSMHRGAGRL